MKAVLATLALGLAAGFVAADEAPSDAVQLYRASGCGACHALGLAGTTGPFGPGHDAMAAVAAERLSDPAYGGSATTVEAYIRESIVDPLAFVVAEYRHSHHRMPAYGALDEASLEALVHLLTEWTKGSR